MSNQAIKLDDFIKPPEPEPPEIASEEDEVPEEPVCDELDVQKTVVEELAVDKAVLNEKLKDLSVQTMEIQKENRQVKEKLEAAEGKISELTATVEAFKSKIAELESQLAAEKMRVIDGQERNPNALALLDRDVELPDRFPGETRDHVLEVIAEARSQAEKEGRVRRAQLLEAVLVANEPNGELAKRRVELDRLFSEHGNVIDGTVLAELSRLGISHKKGEEYLLPDEIRKRAY